MYLLILYFLFMAFFISFFFGRYLNRFLICIFNSFLILNSLILAFIIFFEVSFNFSPCIINMLNWFTVDMLNVEFIFLFDTLTSSMLIVVLFISLLVHIYSIEYMKEDPHQIRFFSYISIFTFFMVVLLTAGNLIQLFIGWEGVGICSYLLVNFWYARISANKSSIMAIIANKVGDIALMVSFCILYSIYKSFNFYVIFPVHVYNIYILLENSFIFIFLICFFFILGAVGKSAQIGLHVWLPEAMEGPTPVSSLIHAATMVTAGIFLIVRCSFLFDMMIPAHLLILFFGSFTAFMGALIGLFQNDIKKIIAYSTCSQLGYMFLSCGLLGYSNGMYHLINHAFFKALLFLSAGLIIYSFNHEQDFRKMGSLIFFFPFAYISILIGSLSLMGFPFFSGFFSKEPILTLYSNIYFISFDSFYFLNFIFFFMFISFFSMIFTILYSIKLIFFVFFNTYNGFKYNLFTIKYGNVFMILPLFILIYMSIFFGFFSKELLIGAGTNFWNNSISIPFINIEYLILLKSFDISNIGYSEFFLFNFEFYEYSRKIPFGWVYYFTLVGLPFFSVFNERYYSYLLKFSSFWTNNIYVSNNQKFSYFNKLFIFPLSDLLFSVSLILYLNIEKGLLERIGPFGVTKKIKAIREKDRLFFDRFIYQYIGFFLLGFFLLVHLITKV